MVGGDAIEQLRKLAIAAHGPRVILGRDDHHLLYNPLSSDGSLERITLPPVARRHEFETVGSLVDFVVGATSGQHRDERAMNTVVMWVGAKRVVVALDDSTRRDIATLELPFSEPFELLASGSAAQQRPQVDMIRMLRVALAGSLPLDSTLLGLLRNVRWAGTGDTSANIQHAKESMGRSITAQCVGTDALPEEVTLHVPVYELPDALTPQRVRCALEVLVHEQMFRLVPLAREIKRARAAALDEIVQVLAECKCPLYRGYLTAE
jgi:hypothetical protein